MKKYLILLLMCCITLNIGANPLARIYQVDDPILNQIEQLSLESGINVFASSGPVSGYELSQQLVKVDAARLAPQSVDRYTAIWNFLHDPYGDRVWDISIQFSQEFYANTDTEAETYDWVEGYVQRRPFLYGQGETIFGDHGYGIISYAYQKAFRKSDFNGVKTNNPLFLNVGNTAVQNSVPHTAFLGFSGTWFTAVAGRDAIRLGRGVTGNLMLGDHVPYHDFFQANFFNSKIRYSFLLVPMNELVTQDMLTAGLTENSLGEAWYPHYNPDSMDAWHTLFHGTLRRAFLSHRIEIDFFPWWRFAMTEGTLFYTDGLDMRMFSPLMFIHNLQNFGEVNNTMGIEMEFAASKQWSLHFQMILDQFQTGGEQDTEDPIPPNAYAFLLGTRYRYPLGSWYLGGYLESVYTSPFLYLRAGDSTHNYGDSDPNTQFNLDLVHAVSMEEGKSGVQWLGYTYGPDSIVLATGVSGSYKDSVTISANATYIIQGERGLEIEGKEQAVVLQPAQQINMLSPSGSNPRHTLISGIGIHYHPFHRLEVYSRNYWINRWDNSGHQQDLQTVFGATYTL